MVNERWRGKMPFRAVGEYRRLLNLMTPQGRGGEPSPSIVPWERVSAVWKYASFAQEQGAGKADGSYTEKLRLELMRWARANAAGGVISFQYKLSRHKIINVVGRHPFVRHNRLWGSGSKGFTLTLGVISIDGMKPTAPNAVAVFAWNKIIARERFLALPPGELAER